MTHNQAPSCGPSLVRTSDIEHQEFLAGRRAGEVTAVDAGVSLLGPAYNEHGQRAVVRPVHAIPLLGDDYFLARRHKVGLCQLALRCRVANPVDLQAKENVM